MRKKHFTSIALIISFNILIYLCINSNSKQLIIIRKEVLKHYETEPRKLEAARFLLENIEVDFSTNIYKEKNRDYITADLLIQNIDISFVASKPLFEAKIIDWKSFLEFTLPYKVNKSSKYNWKKEVANNKVLSSIESSQELINFINKTNPQLSPHFQFDLSSNHEDTLSYKDLLINHKGSCRSMAYLAQYFYRSYGIPVAYDFIITWTNVNGSHSWNSLILSDGKLRPFLGIEQKVGNYNPLLLYGGGQTHPQLSTYKKTSKIFRQVFTPQKNSIAFKYKNTSILPPDLQDFNVIDVTTQYLKTTTIKITPSSKLSTPKILLISNYSSKRWIPVSATEYHNINYEFKNMARDQLYNFISYNNSEYAQAANPIYVDSLGKITYLKPTKQKINIKINCLKSIESDQIHFNIDYDSYIAVAKNILRRRPVLGKKYTLLYWNGSWRKIKTHICEKSNELNFTNIPKNALYLLIHNEEAKDDRPFIYLNGKIKWL